MPSWYWLSYASKEKGFMGVVILRAESFVYAVRLSKLLKLNPGEEVIGYDIGEIIKEIPDKYRGRLLDEKETLLFGEKLEELGDCFNEK